MSTQPATRNYYDVLGVAPKAKLAAIRRRYVTLAQEVHPDRFAEPEEKARKAEEFKWVNEAWQVLSDPVQRGRYDTSLDVGAEFHPAEGTEKTAETIFNDAKRFEFKSSLAALPKSLHEMVVKSLQKVKEFDHRVVATFPVRTSTVGRSPLTSPCGVSQTEYLVLTNMNLSVGILGASETQKGNTKYSMTYSRLESVYLGSIDQIDIGLSFEYNEDYFTLRINASESPFSGIDFECQGSPFVFLWIADLFDIRTRISLRPATSGSPLAPILIAACGVGFGLYIAVSYTNPLVVGAGLLLAGCFAVHGAIETPRVARLGRLIGYTRTLVQRLLKQRGT